MDFSGLVNSACAFASAVAIEPMVSLDRCMGPLPVHHLKAHGAGFRALGADAVAERLLGVLGHKLLEPDLGSLVFEKGLSGVAEKGRELGPRIRGAHVNDAHRGKAWPRRLDPEQPWRL